MSKKYKVYEPHEGASFWQPKPANGYVVVRASPAILSGLTFSQGVQVLPPESFVRLHTHTEEDEVIYCLEGKGKAILEDKEYEMLPGASFVIGRGTSHKFVNSGPAELKFLWTISRPGLEKFFEEIGSPRSQNDPVPESFERPEGTEIDAKNHLLPK